jgi:hypothetical protein
VYGWSGIGQRIADACQQVQVILVNPGVFNCLSPQFLDGCAYGVRHGHGIIIGQARREQILNPASADGSGSNSYPAAL